MNGGRGSGDDGQWQQPLRSKGLLPAIGVGGVVYLVTGMVSVGTLALVGIGAGVGYGVGNWLADKYQKKQDTTSAQKGVPMEQLPWAMQVSLQAWQQFLLQNANGAQLSPMQVEQLFVEFEKVEPAHAQNVRGFVMASQGGQGSAAASAHSMPGGVTVVPTAAAEV